MQINPIQHGRIVGNGNSGTVYTLDSNAYKCVSVSHSHSHPSLREAVWFHSFDCPYLAQSTETIYDSDTDCLSHKLPKGRCTVLDCIKNPNFISAKEWLSMWKHLAQALHWLHSRRMIHGDV